MQVSLCLTTKTSVCRHPSSYPESFCHDYSSADVGRPIMCWKLRPRDRSVVICTRPICFTNVSKKVNCQHADVYICFLCMQPPVLFVSNTYPSQQVQQGESGCWLLVGLYICTWPHRWRQSSSSLSVYSVAPMHSISWLDKSNANRRLSWRPGSRLTTHPAKRS